MKAINDGAARELWAAYVESHPENAHEDPPTEQFGDSSEMADELLELVRSGTKRATAGLVAEFTHEAEPLPRVGGHWIVADSEGQAQVILRSIELRIGRLDSVDKQFAWDEGEGDRSLEFWLDAHRRFFRRACARIGPHLATSGDLDQVEVLFERFVVVWPVQHAS